MRPVWVSRSFQASQQASIISAVPAKTLPEFMAYAKANPGKINFASAGTGTSEHLAGELFKMMSGIDMVHVPFRGGAPAITALIAGDVQAYFCATPTSLSGIKSGMRAVAVTTATRWEALPDVQTVAETLPGYEVSVWFGVGAPKNTPAQQRDRCKPRRSDLYEAASGARRHPAADDTVGLRQAAGRGNRKMDEGDPCGQPEG